jgi:coenzyme F420-reducing hydrogenase gamma subunit
MKWKMTYNNKNMSGCSACGVSLRDTKEELELLKEQLKDEIYNVKIEKNAAHKEAHKKK